MRIEILSPDGSPVIFNDKSYVVSDVLHNKEKSIHFRLDSVQYIAKGSFPIRTHRYAPREGAPISMSA
jgi:hypothetical protein